VQFYPINSNPRDAHELLPLLREYDLEDENEIASGAETGRRDSDPEEGAA